MTYQIKTIKPFEKAVRNLSKKFREIKKDLKEVSGLLEENPFIGVPIPGYEGTVWKVRVTNTSAKRGKQSGFRIVYLINEFTGHCYLLIIYSKTEKIDVTSEEIENLLKALEDEYFSNDSGNND